MRLIVFITGIGLIVLGVALLLKAFWLLWLLVQGLAGLSLVLLGYFVLMSSIIRKH